MKLMERFLNENLPDIEVPLEKVGNVGHGNRGYGSEMDDHMWINLKFYSPNDMDDELFIEWGENHPYSNKKWSVNEKLEPLFEMFGEEAFEEFIKWYFGLDIRDKGNKKTNWMFW